MFDCARQNSGREEEGSFSEVVGRILDVARNMSPRARSLEDFHRYGRNIWWYGRRTLRQSNMGFLVLCTLSRCKTGQEAICVVVSTSFKYLERWV
jgi:hypothetical protein